MDTMAGAARPTVLSFLPQGAVTSLRTTCYEYRVLLADFDYDLPPELIAQEPVRERSLSRLLALDRVSRRMSHYQFSDIVHLLPEDCVLVLNDTKVFPARLRGHKESGGRIELLLLRRLPGEEEIWEVMCKGAQGMSVGMQISLAPELSATWVSTPRDGRGMIRFSARGEFLAILERLGEIPLPPYIKRPPGNRPEDTERYQTVYARHMGAVAAPTAGLHFTPELLTAIRQRGVEIAFLTLHVGAGTFQPMRTEQVEAHVMEEEEYEINEDVARRINMAKQCRSQNYCRGYDEHESLRVGVERRVRAIWTASFITLHVSRIHVPGDRWTDYQFSFATLNALDACISLCWPRPHP